MSDRPKLRLAEKSDLPTILALLRDDGLGSQREGNPDDPVYVNAFDAIAGDANNHLYVVEFRGSVVGCAQLTFIPGLSRRASTRTLIEGVRISSACRGKGLGSFLINELNRIAGEHGCTMVQLTSDKSRADAHRFYLGLGFENSHEGFKLILPNPRDR